MNAKLGPRGFLRTLVDPLDHVLGGGIRSGCITEIVGPAGLGKTQFCLCMCVLGCLDRLDEKGRVLYIDTEKKFSGERLCEIGKSRFPESFAETGSVDEMLRRVIVQVPSSSGNLLEILQVCKDTEIHVQHTHVCFLVIEHLYNSGFVQDLQGAIIGLNIVLIIIDSIASLARAEYGSHTIPERQKLLGRQASTLKSLAESFNIPILVTNQITTQFQDGKQKLVAALGPMWAHAVNTRLELSSGESGSRSLCLSKSSLAPSIRIPYKVTRKGLEVDSAFPCAIVDQGQGMQGVM